jgi:hypothetical protein
MSKFKPGDRIEAIDKGSGFEEAIVLGTFTEMNKGKFKCQEMYNLKIPCGTATIPVSAEYNYQILKKGRLV